MPKSHDPRAAKREILRRLVDHPEVALTPGNFIIFLYDTFHEETIDAAISTLERGGQMVFEDVNGVKHYKITDAGREMFTELSVG